MAETKQNNLVFFLNNERQEIPSDSINPVMSLNEYIRTKTRFKGTKIGCGEGGCGACTVTVARWTAGSEQETYGSINSCLAPLASMDGAAVTTTEGIGAPTSCCSSKKGPHPVQERIAGFNGSQCGFCTPGMVMNLYSALRESGGGQNLTMKDIERRFDGNICRCTGYRPILDAAKSFAADSNVTDQVCGDTATGAIDTAEWDPAFPQELQSYAPQSQEFQGPTASWKKPVSVEEAVAILATPVPEGGLREVVVAATGAGIYKNRPVTEYVCVRAIPELQAVSNDGSGSLTVGAGLSITALLDALQAQGSGAYPALLPLVDFLRARVANTHVRNAGSWGGNLLLAVTRQFLSDLAPGLVALRAVLTFASAGEDGAVTTRQVGVAEALAAGADGVGAGDLLVSATIPLPDANTIFAGFKVAIRPVNCHTLATAVFRASVAEGQLVEGGATVAATGLAQSVTTLPALEAALSSGAVGEELVAAVVAAATAAIDAAIAPGHASEEYRRRIFAGFAYKFALSLLPAAPDALASAIAPHCVTTRPVGTSSQAFTATDGSTGAVGKPIKKVYALSQACGDATYGDDADSPFGTLHATYLTADRAGATFTSLDLSAVESAPGVVAVLTAKDVPGVSNTKMIPLGQEEVFASSKAQFYGQPVGLVLAETRLQSEFAARQLTINYTEESAPAIVVTPSAALASAAAAADGESKDEALAAASAGGKIPFSSQTITCGDADAAAAAAEGDDNIVTFSGTFKMSSQKHFYMEPNNALAYPGEEGSLTVCAANQYPAGVHEVLSTVTGLPLNKITLKHRRAGGSFGAKCFRSAPVTAAVAVAATVLGRPVRMVLDREVDTSLIGGRPEYTISYSGGVTKEGRMEFANVTLDAANGYSPDIAAVAMGILGSSIHQTYSIPNFKAQADLYLTQTTPRTAVRGPQEMQGSMVIETLLMAAASALGKPTAEIRALNLQQLGENGEDPQGMSVNGAPPKSFTHYTVPAMMEEVKERIGYDQKQAAVDAFNAANRWKKRGLAITPVKYHVNTMGQSSLVNIYKDGTVRLFVSGAEIGQGLHTKAMQAASLALGAALCAPGSTAVPVPLSLLGVAESNTDVLPNMNYTGGSTTSESTVGAVQDACSKLVAKLAPIVEKLKADAKAKAEKAAAEAKEGEGDGAEAEAAEIAWPALIAAAYGANVPLSEVGNYSDAFSYHNYGVCASEVELDVITGETTVLSADLQYDCGQSLNPAIDVGQVEGAFMMGLGMLFREKVVVDETTGQLLTRGTWEYKPPCSADVPLQFNVTLHNNTNFDKGVLSSKSSGEPPFVLANAPFSALREAIGAARKDLGLAPFVDISTPALVDDIAAACGTAEFTL